MAALSRAVLPPQRDIVSVNYYTAHVSGRVDAAASARQSVYLRALATLPNVEIIASRFIVSKKWAGLVQPPAFKPSFTLPAGADPHVAYVYKTEEKGSDVNIGVHLVRDAFQGEFDEAAVLTNDTDLVEAIRIVTQDVGLRVTLLAPDSKPSTSLRDVATSTRHVKPYLSKCQFPDQVVPVRGRPLVKPAGW